MLDRYEPAKQLFSNARGVDMPFYQKLIAGCLSGGLGAAISNPFDLYTNKQKNKQEKKTRKKTRRK